MDFNDFLKTYLDLRLDIHLVSKVEAAYKNVRKIKKQYMTSSNNSYAMGILHGMLNMAGATCVTQTVEKLWETDIYQLPYPDESGYEEALKDWAF